jgi:hypothetical protein
LIVGLLLVEVDDLFVIELSGEWRMAMAKTKLERGKINYSSQEK